MSPAYGEFGPWLLHTSAFYHTPTAYYWELPLSVVCNCYFVLWCQIFSFNICNLVSLLINLTRFLMTGLPISASFLVQRSLFNLISYIVKLCNWYLFIFVTFNLICFDRFAKLPSFWVDIPYLIDHSSACTLQTWFLIYYICFALFWVVCQIALILGRHSIFDLSACTLQNSFITYFICFDLIWIVCQICLHFGSTFHICFVCLHLSELIYYLHSIFDLSACTFLSLSYYLLHVYYM